MVRIEGHADASGSDDYNRTLSQRRADAVKQYLVRKGADGAILDAVGLGAEHPKIAADPFAAENRRVEIGRATRPEPATALAARFQGRICSVNWPGLAKLITPPH